MKFGEDLVLITFVRIVGSLVVTPANCGRWGAPDQRVAGRLYYHHVATC